MHSKYVPGNNGATGFWTVIVEVQETSVRKLWIYDFCSMTEASEFEEKLRLNGKVLMTKLLWPDGSIVSEFSREISEVNSSERV